MAKAVERWEAKDGRIFDTREEAIEHERWLDFDELCRGMGICPEDSERLYERRGELLQIFIGERGITGEALPDGAVRAKARAGEGRCR